MPLNTPQQHIRFLFIPGYQSEVFCIKVLDGDLTDVLSWPAFIASRLAFEQISQIGIVTEPADQMHLNGNGIFAASMKQGELFIEGQEVEWLFKLLSIPLFFVFSVP